MRRWGDGQGKHLTGTEDDEIHRRITAGETFAKVAAGGEGSRDRRIHPPPGLSRSGSRTAEQH